MNDKKEITNTKQQNQLDNDKRTAIEILVSSVLIMVIFAICFGNAHKSNYLNKQLKTSKKAAFSWAVKYAEEKDKSDTLITALCQQQFKDFIPKTNYDWIHHDNCRKFIKQTLQTTQESINQNYKGTWIQILRERNIDISAGFLDNQRTK